MSQVTPLPPPDLIALVGGGDYNRIGRHMAHLVRRVGGLRPEHRLLDIGCGCGRLAVQLTGFLTNGYEGLDVHQPHIDWCRENLSREFPLFSFRVMDIRNSHYNLHGQTLASEMSLPYADASFDFVCALSLFTHMLEDGLRRYLSEIRRVLRPGGTLFATHFLVNRHSSQPARRQVRSPISFPHLHNGLFLLDIDDPESAVAYPEPYARQIYADLGLPIIRIHQGGWSGCLSYQSYQDSILATAR